MDQELNIYLWPHLKINGWTKINPSLFVKSAPINRIYELDILEDGFRLSCDKYHSEYNVEPLFTEKSKFISKLLKLVVEDEE